ncbi:MAG: hypothetical protein PHS02_02850, partial [Candidatus ainarchaeum sp.]|nr:hypothetical protein [Candidatus ainarchaeum sp.]
MSKVMQIIHKMPLEVKGALLVGVLGFASGAFAVRSAISYYNTMPSSRPSAAIVQPQKAPIQEFSKHKLQPEREGKNSGKAGNSALEALGLGMLTLVCFGAADEL